MFDLAALEYDCCTQARTLDLLSLSATVGIVYRLTYCLDSLSTDVCFAPFHVSRVRKHDSRNVRV